MPFAHSRINTCRPPCLVTQLTVSTRPGGGRARDEQGQNDLAVADEGAAEDLDEQQDQEADTPQAQVGDAAEGQQHLAVALTQGALGACGGVKMNN